MVNKILENKSETFGFDAQNEEYVDMIDKGIVDPAKVVRAALQDAASVAGLLVTTEAMVAEMPKDQPAMPAMPGGGVTLLRAKKSVGKLTNSNADVQAGINIVLKALEAPIRQIAENAGVEGSIVVNKIIENKSETFGFDAQNEEYVDMLDKGIVDPAKVVRAALQDAASVAGLLVTTEAMIAETPKEQPAMPAMPGGGGGMGGMGF